MNAELKVIRFKFTEKTTISELYLNNTLFCFTLEDTDRGLTSEMSLEEIKEKKQYGITCIPTGEYKVTLFNSPRHGRVPLLHDVKGYSMVEIHKGNFAEDSLGCLLVGTSFGEDRVNYSGVAFRNLMAELVKYTNITISITSKKK